MPNEEFIKKLNTLEEKVYNQLGSKYFVFIPPACTDPDTIDYINGLKPSKLKKSNLTSDYIKLAENLEFPIPTILQEEKSSIKKSLWDFLIAQYKFQQYRWQESLPNFAVYSIEFFLPEMSTKEKVRMNFQEEDLTLYQTINIELPYAIKNKETGEFDPESTIASEQQYHLIGSKIASISTIETISGYLYNELYNFPKWAFFTINHQDLLRRISDQITQVILDLMYVFTFQQIKQGVPQRDAQNNALTYLMDTADKNKLEELLVYRAEKETPLDLYILDLLNEVKLDHPYLKTQTLKDFYKHIFQSLDKLITKRTFLPRNPYAIKIRKAKEDEIEAVGNEYTVEVNLIENNQILPYISEYYQVKLSDNSINNLIIMATQGLKPGKIFY